MLICLGGGRGGFRDGDDAHARESEREREKERCGRFWVAIVRVAGLYISRAPENRSIAIWYVLTDLKLENGLV